MKQNLNPRENKLCYLAKHLLTRHNTKIVLDETGHIQINQMLDAQQRSVAQVRNSVQQNSLYFERENCPPEITIKDGSEYQYCGGTNAGNKCISTNQGGKTYPQVNDNKSRLF